MLFGFLISKVNLNGGLSKNAESGLMYQDSDKDKIVKRILCIYAYKLKM